MVLLIQRSLLLFTKLLLLHISGFDRLWRISWDLFNKINQLNWIINAKSFTFQKEIAFKCLKQIPGPYLSMYNSQRRIQNILMVATGFYNQLLHRETCCRVLGFCRFCSCDLSWRRKVQKVFSETHETVWTGVSQLGGVVCNQYYCHANNQ